MQCMSLRKQLLVELDPNSNGCANLLGKTLNRCDCADHARLRGRASMSAMCRYVLPVNLEHNLEHARRSKAQKLGACQER